MMKNFIVIALTLTFHYVSIAAEQRSILAEVTSDSFEAGEKMHLAVVENEQGVITHLSKLYQDTAGRSSEEVFELSSLNNNTIPIYQKSDREIIRIIFTPRIAREGGQLTLDFLNKANLLNANLDKREQDIIQLKRKGDSWILAKNGRDIENMNFISQKNMLGITVGIKKIQYQ